RVIAWRRPRVTPLEMDDGPNYLRDIAKLRELATRRDEYAAADILSKSGRAWIESSNREDALIALQPCMEIFQPGSSPSSFSVSLSGISDLFAKSSNASEGFADANIRLANKVGLGLLFKAEQMEFARKLGDLNRAARLARPLISIVGSRNDELVQRYCVGTA